ncbi:MAG: class IV adenylate cyclase [Saprospiraceae bacterium]
MAQIIEIKAKCSDQNRIRTILKENNARFVGLDHQIDTYFNVNHGRLKLRQGNIENTLIHYHRPNQKGPKLSKVLLYKPNPEQNLKQLLTAANGVLVEVDKKREIYFIDNVKFHLDVVKGLGTFVEIEAIDLDETLGLDKIQQQCDHYMNLFSIQEHDLIQVSYSDLLLKSAP